MQLLGTLREGARFGACPRRVAALFILCALFLSLARAELIYSYDGHTDHVPLAQLWYEGNWQTLPPMNGTITRSLKGDLTVKIYLGKTLPPHESKIRELQAKGAAAAIFYFVGNFEPGYAMYSVDGTNRSDLWLPVMEAVSPKSKSLDKLPEGAFVQCIPTENQHKRVHDTKFQLILNLIQSFWEIAIACLAVLRFYQFYVVAHYPLFSIAPLCCTLEGLGALIRLGYTVVDPFFSYRMIAYQTSMAVITLSWPFSESAGILLTFYWAETLSRSNIKALPFISKYKWAAIASVIALFALEVVFAALLASLNEIPPIYVAAVLMIVCQITLVVCYLSAALAIVQRIKNRGKKLVRKMTFRIAISSVGYIICIAATISFALWFPHPWGRFMTLNSIFIGLNVAGLMQVLALKPPPEQRLGGTSATTPSANSDRAGSAVSDH